MQNNFYKQSKIRMALIIVLTTMLVLSVSIATYAWFKDSIDIPNPTIVTTGKIDVTLTSYKKTNIAGGSTAWITEELYNSTPETQDTNEQDSALLGSSLYTLDLNDGYDEMFFVVKKTDQSIDVEMVLSFVLNTDDEFINGFTYYLTKIDVIGDKTVAEVLEEESQKTISPINSLININGDAINATLRKEKAEEYVIFRLICSYVGGDLTENAYTDKYYPIQINFSVGQIGSISGESTGNTWRVSTEAELRNALLNYQSNDNINVIKDITYNTDLVLDHPVQLYVRGVTLKINGNLNVTFADTGEFLIDTQNSGKIIVAQVGQSGNFIVDLPNAHMSIVGTGNNAETKGDIYVQNRFSVIASYSRGLDIYRANIYNTTTASTTDTSTEYKDIYVGQSTLITVANRTTVGTLIANSGTTLIKVVNNGTIYQLDFSAMIFDITNNPHSPQLVVENYGTVGKEGQNYSVILGSNSRPCYTEDGLQQSGNTRLINKLGAQFLQGTIAIVGGTTRYYIETDTQVQYVIPVVEGDYTDIIVNYANLYDENSVEITNTTLLDVLRWYFNGTKEADMALIQKMRVICYNGKYLTHDDYNTINTLTSLVSLDLSSCTSENDTFGNLYNLVNLTELLLTEDQILPDGVFAVTQIEEITVPSSYTDVTADSFLNYNGYIKYLHLQGFSRYETLIPNAQQYFLVADNDLVAEYRAIVDDHALKARVFLESEHYGDYFVRIVNNASVEIVAYVGDNFDIVEESMSLGEGNDVCFNFDTFIVSDDTALGHTYYVIGYGDYSFYNKLTSGTKTDLRVGDVSVVGKYAFFGATIFDNIDLNSTTGLEIDSYAFSNTTITNGITLSTNGALVVNEYAFSPTTATTLTISAKSVYIASSAFEGSKTTGITIDVTDDVEIAKRAFFATTLATGATAVPFVINAGGAVVIGSEAFRDNVNKKYFKITDFIITADSIEFLNDFTSTTGNLVSYAFEAATISGNIEFTATKSISIGHNAFQSSKNTTAITLTAETIYTGTNSFRSVTGEAIVTINAKNATLDQDTFNGATITSLTATVEEIFTAHTRAVTATKMANLAVTSQTVTIGTSAFEGCNLMTSLTITSQTVTIGGTAFKGCGSLVNINVVGVGTIGANSFENNTSLLEIVAPGITSVGKNAFTNCSSLLAVVMPSLYDIGVDAISGTSAENSSFKKCGKIKYVETSVITHINGVDRTGSGERTTNFTYTGTTTKVDSRYYNHHYVFNSKIDLYVVNTEGLSNPSYDFLPNLFRSNNINYGMNVLVSQNYQEVYFNSGFGTNYNKTYGSAIIRNADYDGNNRFMAYNEVAQKWEDSAPYVIDVTNKTIIIAQYVYHQKSDGEYQLVCNNRPSINQDTLVVPDSVWIDGVEQVISSLGDYAYRSSKVEVNELVIGDNIIDLNENAFGKWNSTGYIDASNDYRTIAKIIDLGTLPSVVGFKRDTTFYVTGVEEVYGITDHLDSQSFSGLTDITYVNFPNVVELTGQEFFGCTGLERVDFASLKTVSGRAFANCTSLITINMPQVETISNGAFMGTTFTVIDDVTFPKLKTLGNDDDTYGAFENCEYLDTVNFFDENSKLTAIYGTPFAGCDYLQHVYLYNVKNLGANVFKGMTLLTDVRFYSLLRLNDGEFEDCISLEIAEFELLLSVTNRAFAGCTMLKDLYMPNVTTIANGAFMGTSIAKLTYKDFPKLMMIGSNTDEFGAFENCTKLTEVNFYPELDEDYDPDNDQCNLRNIYVSDLANPFKGCMLLESARFDQVETIDSALFAGNTTIKEVYFKLVLTLNNGEFEGCTALNNLYMPNLISVSGGAFSGSGLTEISNAMFPSLNNIGSVTEGEVGAFKDCLSLETILFDGTSQLTKIVGAPFEGCTSLKYVTISKLPTIDSSMFSGNTTILEISFDSVQSLSNGEFANCTALLSASFANCTSVSGGAFENCTALNNVYMPKCTIVTDRAFKNTGFVNITDDMFPVLNTISSTGTSLGEELDNGKRTDGDVFNGAFNGCKKLKSIELSSVTTIGAFAFVNCTTSSYTATFNGLTTMGAYAFGRRDYTYESGKTWSANSISSFTAPNLTSISTYTFAYSKIKTISATSVTAINTYAFYYAQSLTTVDLPMAETIGGASFNACTVLKTITLPSAKTLGNSVFGSCSALVNASLPLATSMGEKVFYGLTKLQYVDLTSLETMGNECFRNSTLIELIVPSLVSITGSGDHFRTCSKLERVYAPLLTSIGGDETFKSCSSLTNVYMPIITTVPQHCFYGCAFKQINGMEWTEDANMAYLPNLTTMSGGQIFYNCKNLEKVYLEEVTTVGANSFATSTKLVEAYLPKVTSFPQSTFNGCTSLQRVYAPSVKSFGKTVFNNCKSLTNIYLPALTTLGGDNGDGAFSGCTSLQYVNGGDYGEDKNILYAPLLTTDCSNAFKNCTSLKEVYLDNIVRIRNNVFDGCTNLTKISLLKVAQFGNSVFYNCKNLGYLYLPELKRTTSTSFENCTGVKVLYAPNLGNGSDVSASLLAKMTNLKVAYLNALTSANIANISDSVSVCVIFENGILTTPTTVRLPIVVSGNNASNYLTEVGYSRAEVEDLSTELVFMDENGILLTYDQLFNTEGVFYGTPVASFKKAMDGTLELLRMDTIELDEDEKFSVPDVVLGQNGMELYRVIKVADYAYYGLEYLTIDTLTFGDNITKVGNSLFNDTISITTIDYNNVVEAGAMYIVTLTNIYGDNLTTIAENAFANNAMLSMVDLPALTVLPSGAFYGCTALTSVKFNGVEYVVGGTEETANAIFGNCTSLQSVVFGQNLLSITGKVFDDKCTVLTDITIENSTQVVSFNNIAELGIPTSAKLLVVATLKTSYSAQWSGVNVDSFQLAREVGSISYYLNVLADGTLEIAHMLSSDPNRTRLALPTTVEGKKVVSISREAMQVIGSMTKLETLTLPTYLRHFDNKDLLPTSLQAFAIDNANSTTYKVYEGVLYANCTITVDADGYEELVATNGILVSYPASRAIVYDGVVDFSIDFELPTGVTIISSQAFVNTRYLETIFLGNSVDPVVFVGEDIFGNSSVQRIVIPNGSTAEYVKAVLVDKKVVDLFIEEDDYSAQG